jgi:carbamoyl-phosphate synthase large subunit
MNLPLKLLVTGVGGPTPRSFARALRSFGSFGPYRLFGTDINPRGIGLYQLDLFESCYLTPPSSSPDYWDYTTELVDKLRIDAAIVLPEVEVAEWSRRQAQTGLPCKALIPDTRLTDLLMDKAEMSEVLAPFGMVPRSLSVSLDDTELRAKVESTLTYPFWVRSATGSSGLGSYKVTDFEMLEHWLKINKGVERFLASEFLPGRNLACKLLFYKGELLRAACAERVRYIMAKTSPSGITGNTSFGRLINDQSVVDQATQAIDLIFKRTGAARHGFFTVDLKEDSAGKPLLTEINIRHVAFTSAFAAAGANLCEDTIRLLMDDPEFNRKPKVYSFPSGTIFLRDVDSLPIVMNEAELLK